MSSLPLVVGPLANVPRGQLAWAGLVLAGGLLLLVWKVCARRPKFNTRH